MPVNTEDRPLKKIREEVIDQLVMNYAHEEITLTAFEKRLDIAMETEDRSVLLELVADLDLTIDDQYQKTKAEKLSSDKHFFDGGTDEHLKISVFMSSSTQNGPWLVGESINVTNILGTMTLDFTEAIFNYPVVHLKVFSLLSTDKILVPEGVRVVSKTSNYLSSVTNQLLDNTNESTQTIVIHGNTILSSMVIMLKVTLKEKWLKFADGVRSLFE